MAQINPTVGDIAGNSRMILTCAKKAASSGCDLVIFPELALTGYPPEDLLLKPKFIEDNLNALSELARSIKGITAVIGFIDSKDDIYNAAAVCHKGSVVDVYHKMYLPNYGVFDERRYFRAGTTALSFTLRGVKIGIGICEDIWYPEGPARVQALSGAKLIVNVNASPYHMGKALIREEMLVARALDNCVSIAYNNTVGGQDELVFDGHGLIIDSDGTVIARGRAFEEDLVIADLGFASVCSDRIHDPKRRASVAGPAPGGLREIILDDLPSLKKPAIRPTALQNERLEDIDEVLDALILGTRDYVRKNGFSHVVIGLSGGIDSALVAGVASLALGPENITCVFMPSEYSSKDSLEDASAIAKNLSVELLTIPIGEAFSTYKKLLKPAFAGRPADSTEENLQARIRGNLLMALSNKFGWLVLTTGNKSEMSVGYATLYGDMAGGFAVIKDVPKTLVYKVAERFNKRMGSQVIPERVLVKAPTAELRPNQTDQDTLPPYDVLDRILKAYIEDDRSLDEIVSMGFSRALVKKVTRMVDLSEYKRRQAPPGIKITPRAFGRDRRIPITNGYDHGSR